MSILKEKFNELVPKEFGGMQEPTLSECTKIAEDFAVSFVEWIDCKYYQGEDFNEYYKSINEYRKGDHFTAKELLEIFKK
jgi:hypothetical protein